jgi:hypothetical protein
MFGKLIFVFECGVTVRALDFAHTMSSMMHDFNLIV